MQHNYVLDIEVIQAQNSEELLDKVVQSVIEELSEQREDLPFPASLATPLERTVLTAFTEPKLFAEAQGVKGYSYMFQSEDVRAITVANKSLASKYGPILLLVAVVLLTLATFLRLRRRRR